MNYFLSWTGLCWLHGFGWPAAQLCTGWRTFCCLFWTNILFLPLWCPQFLFWENTVIVLSLTFYCFWTSQAWRKDLIVKWIWLLHAVCQPWGLKEEPSNGRTGTHPPLPTTACTPHADIFTGVGAISNHTSTRPGCFDRKAHMKQQKPLREKRKKAFHGPHTEYLLCNTHSPSPTTDPIRLDWEVPRCSSLSAMHMQQFWSL